MTLEQKIKNVNVGKNPASKSRIAGKSACSCFPGRSKNKILDDT